MPSFIPPRLWPALALAALACARAAAQADDDGTLPAVDVRAPLHGGAPSVLGPVALPMRDAPASVHVFDAAALQAPGVATLSRLLAADTSVQPNYATAGYHENFSVRGFTLDAASSWRINGFRVPGELLVALDNKEAVELLKGAGALDGGALGPGGTLNLVTQRPADTWQARVGADDRGGSLLGADWGRTGLADGRLGLRLNLAHEELRPQAHAARGQRDFASLALDLRATRTLTLQADLEYGRRSQPAVPGVQLLGGLLPPPGLDPRININRQPWTRPTGYEGHFAAVRALWQIDDDLRLGVGLSDALSRIDDNLATPSGCNHAPYNYFCADGSYVLYDYHARERRRTQQLDAQLQGRARRGGVTHDWSLGVEQVRRRVAQGELGSTTRYDDAGLAQSGHLLASGWPLPAPDPDPADLPTRRIQQMSLALSDQIRWGDWQATLGLRQVHTRLRGTPEAHGSQHHTLPFAALGWTPAAGHRVYAQAARGLDLGSEAPVSAENAGALLPPRVTRQVELGWRHERDDGQALSLALFRMQRPWDFTAPQGQSWAGLGAYQRAGTQVHTGLEAAGRWRQGAWTLDAAATWLRARAQGSGEPAFDGVQLQNQPRLRTQLALAYAPPQWPGVRLDAAWQHAGARHARRDGLACVPGYDTLDLGAQWQCPDCVRGARTTLALVLRNATDRRYWRDVGEAYSADLLFPGAPRSLALMLTVQGR